MSGKIWKKLLATGCAVSLLATAPGMTVLADQFQEDDVIVTEAEDPEQLVEPVEEVQGGVIDENVVSASEEDDQYEENAPSDTVDTNYTANEEVVGEEELVVGDGVTARYDVAGIVEFYSNGGTLWANWTDEAGIDRQSIESIKVGSGTVYLPADSSGYNQENWEYQVFGGLNNLEDLDLSGFDTSNVTDMSNMFLGCSRLSNLDLSSFDTTNVTNMRCMFRNCHCLTSLNLSSFDTSKVTDMNSMFCNCSGLTNLDLSNFDTSNVTDMDEMFYWCNSLTNLDLSNMTTPNVTDMGYMFSGCNSIPALDLSGFNTSNVANMQEMFASCENLTSLDLNGFDTSNVNNMSDMFYNCSSLTELDLRNFNTSKVTNMEYMFGNCENLKTLDLSSFDNSMVRYNTNIFKNCRNLLRLRTPQKNNLPTNLPIAMCDESGAIYNKLPVLSKSITLTRVENGEIYVGENVTATFDEETGAVEFYSDDGELWDNWLDMSGIDVKDIRSIAVATGTVYLPDDSSSIFSIYIYEDGWQKSNLKELNLSGFDTSNVRNMCLMFNGCNSLTNLDLSGFDTSNVTNMAYMFSWCSSLTDLDLSNFSTSNVTEMQEMFYGCRSLTNLDLSGIDTSNIEYHYSVFDGCDGLETLKTPKVNSCDIDLPIAMHDEFGNEYDKLPVLSKSIFLKREKIIVGDGVTASFNERTGSVQFYSDEGTLWNDWLEKSGFDIEKISSISVASGTVFLPEDSSYIFSVVYTESDYDGENDSESVTYYYNLQNLDLRGFNTSKVTNMAHMFQDCASLYSLNLSNFDTS